MDTERRYQDINGNARTLYQMVRREPDWAASRIQQCESLETLLREWYAQQQHRTLRGNAPGHGHQVTGIWDSDNGDIAGKPCAECQLWARAVAISKPARAGV